ncbi:MAG TPA: UTP--glucose-1-phosphate uridylyltransferase [Propioniciclava tarda]|nr:UTP--glucose-1-phosphate uridylyltransferase [Propioniciclava tarda]HQA31702.1 UTP--glucose-1-phosphate uridylyltransferase [Propioniciclava tarda]HQD61470.1 UTP--glucose-1-phosphate uridylyltransferase [Propioniciclava tarda]
MAQTALDWAQAKMRDRGVAPGAIDSFAHYFELARSGATGIIAEASIEPLTAPESLAGVQIDPDAARQALAQTVMIKLNGGLGTSMGLDRAKSLLSVRDGKNFLDLQVAQVLHARRAHGVRLPLLFMNSFRTRDDTLAHLARYGDLAVEGLPLDFVQNAIPKIDAQTFEPVAWPDDPELEWCPPGHGDIYVALEASGILEDLLDKGFRYASLANGDNLGAGPNATLAGWFAASGAPYAAEVCVRTPNDRKGGHLAVRRSDGQLILRDTAQTAPDEMDFFTDEHRHPYFHANNLWLDLRALADRFARHGAVLGLPLIVNRKTVDPADPTSTPVLQLETAMGAAIEVFPGARAIAVGRDRFLPVKGTNELLLLRSDVFDFGPDAVPRATVPDQPRVDLGAPYRLVDDFERLVPVVPSLRQARSLTVRGAWTFDQPVTIVGDVTIPEAGAPASVPGGVLGDA